MPPLQQLLQQLHELQQPYSTQFDDRLFIAVLLALAAGHRNLVVRVTPLEGNGGEHEEQRRELKREKKEWVQRVADEVEWICSTIFALTTHRVACSPKTPPSAFVKSLFLPPPELAGSDPRKDGLGSRHAAGRRTTKRSNSAPLDALFPNGTEGGTGEVEARRPKSPGLLEASPASRRQAAASESILYPSSAPATHLTFEEPLPAPYTGPSPEAGDSSAGEDLYPVPTSSSLGRRNTLSPKLRADSPDRRRAGGRRHTLGAKDLLRSGQESLVGLGLGGSSATGGNGTASRLTPPRPGGRPASPRSASGSGYFSPSSRSPLHQHASYLSQTDRRPSIASIQSTFSTSTAGLPTPSANRFLRSPTGPPSPPTLNAPHVASPLSATSPSFIISPAPRTPRASSPTPPRMRGAPQPAATFPPVTRPSTASGGVSGSFERTLPQVLILEHLERARPSAQQALLSILRDERIVIAPSGGGGGSGSAGNLLFTGPPRRGTPAIAADDASSMRTRRTTWTIQTRDEAGGGVGSWEGSWNLPEGFLCVAVVRDEDKSWLEKHDGGWGGVSRHLLDRFSLSHTVSSALLLSPSRFHAPPPSSPQPHPLAPTPHSLLSPLPLPSSLLPSYLSDTLDTYISDLISALRHHPQIEGRMLTARAARELEEMVKVWVGLTKGEGGVEFVPPSSETDDKQSLNKEKEGKKHAEQKTTQEQDKPSPLVLPSDVLSVILSVLGHRLALRKPRDEKSLFWGSDRAALEARRGGGGGGRGEKARRKVEDVVREVVAVV